MASKKSTETAAETKTEIVPEIATAAVVATKQGFDHTVAALKDSMTGAVAGFEQTQTEIKSTMDKAFKTAEDFFAFGQANVEAVVKSSQIWTAGVQDFGKSFAGIAQAQMDQTVATFKAMAGVKSLKDAMELQTTLARSSVEAAMTETGKITDASMKLAEQAIAPIAARVTIAVEKFAAVEKFGRAA